jgi:O-antigen/teichoic acid export membrane protein
MNIITTKIRKYFSVGHERSLKAKKNIATTFFLKGFNIIIGLIIVPLTINYVNPTQYGIWLTLSSIITWFSFFDIGLGNGLKNKLIQALADEDYPLAKTYVSTTYFIIGLISLFLLSIFVIGSLFINWATVLNASQSMQKELTLVAIVVFSIFSFQFVLQLINTVAIANQSVIVSSLTGLIGNFLGLIIVFIFTKTTHGSLIYLCLSIGISPLVVLLIFNLVMFNTKYKKYAPSFKYVKLSYAKSILELGFKFFIIQIGLIFFYNLDNILISNIVGPSAVTSYNIAYKYFSVITMISNIVMTPFWAAFAEAHLRGDTVWIKASVRKLSKIVIVVFVISLIMLMASKFVYHIWVGDKVLIPFTLSLILAFYTAFNTYRTIFVYYVNGVGKLNVQFLIVFIAGLLNIPFGILLGRAYGSTGVILSTTILCILCGIIEITQYKKLISNTAKGIWNR